MPHRRGDDYGEDDMAMRWLLAHDPDAQTGGWSRRHGVIDKKKATAIRNHEVTLSFIEDVANGALKDEADAA
jgi:hypothetical protein